MVRYVEHNSPYIDYYVLQAQNKMQVGSGNLPVFAGARWQRGYGVGSVLRRVRAALPAFFKSIGRHLLRSAMDVGQDVLSGQDIRRVAGRRLLEGVKNAAVDVGPSVLRGIKTSAKELFPQIGSGKRKRRVHRKNKLKRRKLNDIFA